MKNFKSVLASVLAGAMMCACTSDQFIPDDGHLNGGDGDGFFMALDIQMPDGKGLTRSTTTTDGNSSDGTEIGQDYENYVSNALIVLAASEDIQGENLPQFGFIAAAEVQNNRINEVDITGSKQYRAYARLQKTNISELYKRLPENSTVQPLVYVFVFCNPTKDLVDLFSQPNLFGKTDWIDWTCNVIQGSQTQLNQNIGIWGSNSFLMNNVALTKRALPSKELDWERYNSYENSFHLSDLNEKLGNYEAVDNSIEGRGPVRVERSVARFDFKDASNVEGEPNTYEVLYALNADGSQNTEAPLVNIELEKMCLVNMSNQFYYLPRVSADGTNTNSTLCGAEAGWERDADGNYKKGNFVVGPYASKFQNSNIEKDFTQYFNYAFFENNGSFNNNAWAADRWDVVKISDILNNTPDQYVNNDKKIEKGSYRIWRYVTENAIPGIDQQVNGISTGVVFKGELKGSNKVNADYQQYEEVWERGSAQNLANCLNGKEFTYNGKTIKVKGNGSEDPILYYYAGRLYMGWRHIRQAAIQAAGTINAAGQLEINRSNSLYKAVFGEAPIPPTYTITIVNGNETTEETKKTVYYGKDGTPMEFEDPQWTADPAAAQAKWETSPDGLWVKWNGEGKPVGGDGTFGEVPAELTAFRKAVTAGGVTIYQSSLDEDYVAGYYCYYYYWNRHNDNNRPGVMGPMEFAVVRNNVYKLSVDKITRLGHPRIPDNDPEPPTPTTPDESDQIYLDVRVQILPWSVRLNGIVF